MIIIKTLHFEGYEDFTCVMSDVYDRVKSNDEYNSVDVIVKYEDAKEIIRELVGIGYGIAFINEFGNPEWDGYDDAFVITLYEDEIWCEPIKRDNRYIFVEANIVYILDDCNSKIISNIEADEIYEVGIDNGNDDCDGDCENCDCHNVDTTSTYKINGRYVDKETYEKYIEDIQKKYLEKFKKSIEYWGICNEMNEYSMLLNR